MLAISEQDIAARLRADNHWWQAPPDPSVAPYSLPRRDYFDQFVGLVQSPVQRAVILLGARRVGKTTLLRQMIGGFLPRRLFGAILFASIDTPTYTGLSLGRMLIVRAGASTRFAVAKTCRFRRDSISSGLGAPSERFGRRMAGNSIRGKRICRRGTKTAQQRIRSRPLHRLRVATANFCRVPATPRA